MLIADIVNAFWNIPLNQGERRFFTAKYKKWILVFLRTAQGSRNAPLSWGHLVALLGRLAQAMFDGSELRLQTYVDDPAAAVRGPLAKRNRYIAILVVAWLALGNAWTAVPGQSDGSGAEAHLVGAGGDDLGDDNYARFELPVDAQAVKLIFDGPHARLDGRRCLGRIRTRFGHGSKRSSRRRIRSGS